ncbi:plasmid partitioning protein RepB C-terminal domain-containing protein [Chelativorans sp. J32]|uniref:plasmid partitioning protein RepB C-terminal domain-containing protein n=1 Tax=Chelativorans sp. J32 TaxID=935840 RepID=UPI002110CADC|nr:plasmid partitioning protein RepB C-terminal domain-containing protein [Chelativorans sp. J32]
MLDEGVRHFAADVGGAADRGRGPDDRAEQFSDHVCRARAATPDNQLAAAKKGKGAATPTPSGQQIARMERELAALQTQVKSVEETYGIDNLHLTVARGYIAKLLANGRVACWLANHRQEYLGEF